MAQLFVAAIRDLKADCYSRPFFVTTKGMAIRSFIQEVNRVSEDNPLYRYSADYRLYLLGYFDESSGELSAVVPELLMDGVSAQDTL